MSPEEELKILKEFYQQVLKTAETNRKYEEDFTKHFWDLLA